MAGEGQEGPSRRFSSNGASLEATGRRSPSHPHPPTNSQGNSCFHATRKLPSRNFLFFIIIGDEGNKSLPKGISAEIP
jgi:hypothetical protein